MVIVTVFLARLRVCACFRLFARGQHNRAQLHRLFVPCSRRHESISICPLLARPGLFLSVSPGDSPHDSPHTVTYILATRPSTPPSAVLAYVVGSLPSHAREWSQIRLVEYPRTAGISTRVPWPGAQPFSSFFSVFPANILRNAFRSRCIALPDLRCTTPRFCVRYMGEQGLYCTVKRCP